MGLYLICLAAFVLPAALAATVATFAGAMIGKIAVAVVVVVGLVAGICLGFRCFAGFLHAVAEERLSAREALAAGRGFAAPLAWLGFLAGFIVFGGFMLLVIPGVIFMVWFFFAQFVLVQEDVHGMGALLKSKDYVKGEWFNVFLRLLLLWTASALIGAIPIVGPILGIVFFPYTIIFQYLIYRDLRGMKGSLPSSWGTAETLKWPGIAFLGYVAVPVVVISVIGMTALSALVPFVGRNGTAILSNKTPKLEGTESDTGSESKGLRVITFPKQETSPSQVDAQQPATLPHGQDTAAGQSQPSMSTSEEHPDNLHVFIYAANYTGRIKANGGVMQELGGKTDMQYNYNISGKELRYGSNQIEVDYSELPSHHEGLLSIHIKVSRNAQGKPTEVLGDYRIEEKGQGTKSFTLDIPK